MRLENLKFMDIHNHTSQWSDGWHTARHIINNAVNNGIKTVGVSDHYFCYKPSLPPHKLSSYIKSLNELKEEYKSRIKVMAGLEICMDRDWGQVGDYPYDLLNELDYLLLEDVEKNDSCVKLMELGPYIKNFKCPVGLAHNDILKLTAKYGINEVMKFLEDNEIFFELNVSKRYTYFDKIVKNIEHQLVKELFTELKDHDIQITVGSDTHILNSYHYDINRLIIGNLLAAHRYEATVEYINNKK